MFSQDRGQLRRFYVDTWRKVNSGAPLQPLEQLIGELVRQHPEYHPMLEDADGALDREFFPEMGVSNPFLHLGLHIALREQVAADRPLGIGELYGRIVAKVGDAHEAEHAMMECLAEMIWQGQRQGTPPDEQAYLACLKKMADGSRS